ncbi:MAG: peptidoglycan DD-metalloendopeptidase family protein [Chloroflexi bacterium]|nr:peptidoglycan DD-metalloendopeptidase family protein [Chloroflexota bacterium]MDA1239531.1 peptidoglycan DD-metalloendopeptidase family protein [Chloroflexota bacterium]
MGAVPAPVTEAATNPVLRAERLTLPGLAAAVPTAGVTSLTAGPVPLTVVQPPVAADAVLAARDGTLVARNAIAALQEGSSQTTTSVDNGTASERIPIFFEYEVQPGDTISGIASHFGVNGNSITWNNVDVLSDNDLLLLGMKLQIPSVDGIIHSVRVGETVTAIAVRYDADWRDVVAFRANGLGGDPNNIREGALILVPGGRKVPLAPPPAVVVAAPGGTGSGGWVWPGGGPMTSSFGPSHPLGIDISMSIGSPISTAKGGQVAFVGGNPCCSYGYHIIIDHGDGYETLYAHLSDFAVGNGQFVDSGDIIGFSGNSGRSTGPHLHFEVRRNGQHLDPLTFLP